MLSTTGHQGQCPPCQQEATHPDQLLHSHMNLLLSRLQELQRRWYAAVESTRLGLGGDQWVAQITGLDPTTIQRGREELAASLAEHPTDRVRAPGAGRPRAAKKPPSWKRPCGRSSRPTVEAPSLAHAEPAPGAPGTCRQCPDRQPGVEEARLCPACQGAGDSSGLATSRPRHAVSIHCRPETGTCSGGLSNQQCGHPEESVERELQARRASLVSAPHRSPRA